MSDPIVGEMKEARLLLPHRSNSVIQDWIRKGVAAASPPQGTGYPYQFTFFELLDLLVVDQLSLLGVFQKPYRGPNNYDRATIGNVYEAFDYLPLDKPDERRYPTTRDRKNAIDFYRQYDCRVIVTISLKRYQPQLDEDWLPKKQTKVEAQRSKVGQLYFNIDYFAEDRSLYTDQTDFEVSENPHQMIIDEVENWREGNTVGKGPTLCMISVDLLRKFIQEKLELYRHPVDYFAREAADREAIMRRTEGKKRR
jgi:hypothetical protein